MELHQRERKKFINPRGVRRIFGRGVTWINPDRIGDWSGPQLMCKPATGLSMDKLVLEKNLTVQHCVPSERIH